MSTTTPSSSDAPAAAGPARSSLNFPVVGIGASAGGLEALLRFFEQMPAHAGMAFVAIMHLSPKHESSAAAILQRATRMPVRQVTEPTKIESDHVYVIPPGVDLLMNDGYLQPKPSQGTGGPRMAIDVFFRTLAQVHRERAVCIVLSGTGSDGSVGLTRIKEHGGIAMAQTPDDAAHEGMPRAAISTGMVDIVLPAVDMPQRLVDLWQNARNIRLPDAEDIAPFIEPPAGPAAAQQAEQALQEVMGLLRGYTRHDFRHYKRATVLRRIERRLQVNRLADLPAYRDHLRDHPEEAVPLLQDMLISVTNFFRDRDAFEALEREAIPALFTDKEPGEQVRAWAAGCATGEEAYSLSVLLREAAELHDKPVEVQVFATDIDERAIAVARKGSYPEGIVADISPARLRQYFLKDQDRFRVAGMVREQVLFAVHDLLRDPPFSRLDLICCRNLLIYLDREAQARALEIFRVALRPGGYLFLGSSESADAAGNLFTAVDKKHRIFRANPQATHARHLPLISDLPGDRPKVARTGLHPNAVRHERPGFAELHLRALEQLSPPSVLLDADHNVLHLSDGVGRFLERAGGEPSHNLLHNVRPDIRLELRTALFRAAQTNRSVETRIAQKRGDGRKVYLNLTVRPLEQDEGRPPLMLVVFDEVDESLGVDKDAAPDVARELMVSQLEEEIRQLKLHLQNTLESSESSTEELKASNEELQAINEELRSATEELETSKEELQSINEELITVNYELKVKVEERGNINDDLQNLIASSEVATVFVDQAMRIKRYTPHASTLFNLIPSDLGRPLFDMTSRLDYPDLAQDAEAAFQKLRAIERRVQSTDGRHFVARILPYRTAGDKIDGAVLNFFDVTELRRAEEQVRAGEERLRVAASTTRDFAIITTDEGGAIVTWNAGAQRIFGYRDDEMIGRPFAAIFTPEDRAKGVPEAELRKAREEGRSEDERWHQRKDGSRLFCSGVTTPLESDVGKGFAKIARDMTGTKQQEMAQEHLLYKEQRASLNAQTANELKDKFLAVMSHELKQPLNLIQMNAELLTRLPEVAGHPGVRRIGETIKRAVGSQSKIINDLLDLLDLSRIRTGKLRLNRTAVALDEVAHTLAHAGSADLERKKLALEVNAEEGLVCHGDRVRIEQVVWNLINNAVKFTPEGGRITVEAVREGDMARISVSDTGSGIAPEFVPHVFGMFNQAGGEDTAANTGLGIGLALVQELTHAHGGEVAVASDGLGKGATFTVRFPLQEGLAQATPEQPAKAVSFAHWRVLAVDDYAEGLMPFAEVLRLEGAIVDVAQSGQSALAMLEANKYDLLISDLGMPGMDGYELIAEVRRRPASADIPAIAMSGYGRRADARRALNAGFNAHVPKPASVEELKAVLGRL
ncbi:chemotaxis protein CheB [Variovorax sp. dw_308]|uniref:chemotaxis protein CheB n=1 Tax=Variovorax sp. dw_308 TaxID=2721546 RepID=UPI001C4665C3|nr:chemotaxis protein CheB [Variovorax sp. dw_308]